MSKATENDNKIKVLDWPDPIITPQALVINNTLSPRYKDKDKY